MHFVHYAVVHALREPLTQFYRLQIRELAVLIIRISIQSHFLDFLFWSIRNRSMKAGPESSTSHYFDHVRYFLYTASLSSSSFPLPLF